MKCTRAAFFVLICLLFTSLVPVFSFESEQEKNEAVQILSIVRDPGVRDDLKRNIVLGNIATMTELTDAIERYQWEEYKPPDFTALRYVRPLAGGLRVQLFAPKVYASGGHFLDKIRVVWSSVPDATHYKVFRSTRPTGTKTELTGWLAPSHYPPAGAESDPNRIGPQPDVIIRGGIYYDDHDADAGWDTWYYYFVKAASDENGTDESDYSKGYGPNTEGGFRAPWDPWNPPDNEQTIAKAEKLFETGEFRFKYENYRGAIDSYTRAIEKYPQYARAYYKRGLARYNLYLEGYAAYGGKFGRIRDYKQAAKLGDTDAQNWLSENDYSW